MDWLEQLYEAHHRQALGVAFSVLGNRGDAEDVVQEAFMVAWRARERFDPQRGTTRAWFLTLVRHRAIDALRARHVRKAEVLDDEPGLADGTDVVEAVLAGFDGVAVRRALARLSVDQRQAIELAFFQGMTHSQIAEYLALPLGTVKGRVRLALDRLRLVLGDRATSPELSVMGDRSPLPEPSASLPVARPMLVTALA
jgi:RNA polymerase sigma-70 factor (ECF subfamily)